MEVHFYVSKIVQIRQIQINIGHIRSSNLCTEIFQNTNPNHYKIKIEFEDGTIKTFEEEDLVIVDGGITKKQIR